MNFRSEIAILVALTSPAVADDTGESLFNEARELLRVGDIANACDKLDASVKAFEAQSAGANLTVAAMINLADCREQNKQLATAWSLFLTTAQLAQNHGNLAVATEARRRAGLLQPRVSTLTVAIADANRIDGLTIEKAGVAIETATWNQGIPVDGGTYVVTAKAPQNAEWSTTVEVPAELGRITIEIPRLKQLADLAPAVVTAPIIAVAPVKLTVTDDASSLTPLQWSGIGAGAVGVLGLAVGTYFSLRARSIDEEARGWTMYMPDRFAEGRAAERNAIIGLAAGGACVVAGGVLFYLGYRSRQATTVAVAPSSMGIGVIAQGSF